MALGKRAWRWRKRAWRGAIVKLARGNTNQPVSPKVQWKYVQALSDTFWKRWRTEYLQTLQNRRKWQADVPNLKPGDVVLLKDCSVHRNNWPMGVITRVFPSEDGRVRKAEVRVVSRESGCSLFVRPLSQLILLVSET